VEGGPVEQILGGISVFWWSVTDVGIFLVTRESEFDAIDQYKFDDHKIVRVGRLSAGVAPVGTLNVSPDGRWALVSYRTTESDLMMVDDFK
jgi:hypothetical protein